MPYWFDGNNLIGQSAAVARKDRHTRIAFLSELALFRKSGGSRLLVYFDGEDPGDSTPPPGISVRYSAPESADAAIIRRLREIARPAEVTVVTNDLELLSQSRRAGAQSMNWRQFTARMQARPEAPSRSAQHSGDRVDVDEWMRYFGLDKSSH